MRHLSRLCLSLSLASFASLAACSSDGDSAASEAALAATDTVTETHEDFGPLRFRDIFFSYAKGTPSEANFDKLIYLAGDKVRATIAVRRSHR